MAIVIVISGFLLYVLDPLFVHDDSNSLKSTLGFAFVLIFITYNVYLIIYNLIFTKKTYSLFTKGLFCSIFEIVLFGTFLQLLAGSDSSAFILNVVGCGIWCFAIPYIHQFLSGKLSSISIEN